MHTTKNKRKEKEKEKNTRNNNTLTTTKTTKEILQKQRLQEGNDAQALSSNNRRSLLFTLDKHGVPKTMTSARQYQAHPVKVRP
jgi:hypothetical protein